MGKNKLAQKLPPELSLQVKLKNKVVFQSNEKWLYPLFELEAFLESHPLNMSEACLIDKVIGKAAALFLLRLNAGCVHAILISEPAVHVLFQAGVPLTYEERVALIACQTEQILVDIDDPEQAYQILCKRAKKFKLLD